MTGRKSRVVALKNLAWTLPELAGIWWITDSYGIAWGLLCATALTLYVVYTQASLARSIALAYHLKEEGRLTAIMIRLEISSQDLESAMLSYTTPESRAAMEKIFDDVGL